MKALFDLNVVLDLLLDRQPWADPAKRLLARILAGEFDGYVCAVSVPTLFYIVRKNASADRAALAVQRCLQVFAIAPVDGLTLTRAATLPGKDYEDNVLIAAASAAGLDVIVTRNAKDFAGAPMRVIAPDDLEAELAMGAKPNS